jgi:hypothetical protein
MGGGVVEEVKNHVTWSLVFDIVLNLRKYIHMYNSTLATTNTKKKQYRCCKFLLGRLHEKEQCSIMNRLYKKGTESLHTNKEK